MRDKLSPRIQVRLIAGAHSEMTDRVEGNVEDRGFRGLPLQCKAYISMKVPTSESPSAELVGMRSERRIQKERVNNT